MNDACAKTSVGKKEKWMTWCRTIQTALPTVHEDNTSNPGYVNLNVFIETLFKTLASDAVVVTGNGTAYTSTFQVMHVKEGMRVIANQGCASMGYDLPAAIGACYANNKRPVVALTGDGSIQMNIQELATISHNALPVKIFVLDNNGYLAIRTTQDSFFNGRHVASDPASGVGMPDLMKIANAYGIPCFEMRNSDSIMPAIVKTLEVSGPALCVVKMDPQQTLFPKVASMKLDDGRMISKPIDDMFPFISPELKQRYSYNA
jgi:acetolactate synthase-1/2/3 large subunit